MERYVQLKKGVADYGKIIPVEDLDDKEKLNSHIKTAPNRDWYVSLYYYGKEAKDYFKKNNDSIAGYKGEAFSNKLVFDFDSKDLEEAKDDAVELLQRLEKEGIDVAKNVRVFFSGCKGFHIEVPVIDKLSPKELKTVCSNIARDLKTFDSVVYNTTRPYRLRDTKHQKSGLYKVELDPDDLLNLSPDQIKDKAKIKTKSFLKTEVVSETSFLDKYRKKEIINKPVVVSLEEVDGIKGLDTIDFNMMPAHIPRCVYALEHGVMVPGIGERSQIFLRLASYYRNQGYSKEKAYNALKAVARLNSRLYPDAEPFDKSEIWNTCLSSSYEGSWKQIPGATGIDAEENEVFKRYCIAIDKYTHRKCCLHNETKKKNTVVKIEDTFEDFSNFAQNFEKNTIKTGIDFIDDHMKITTGTTTLVAGAAGSGKTTFCLNVMENANKNDLHTMFFSMDMNKNLVSLKLAQKLTSYSQNQILRIFQTKDRDKMAQIREAMKKTYGKTYFDFSSTLTFDQMRNKVLETEQANNVKIKLVVVDYAGRIVSDKSDSYANAKYNALKSVEVAGDTDAAWLILTQISRNSGDGCSPIRTKRAAKDSGDWEESATNVITLWRPFLGGDPQKNSLWEDDVMRLYLAKNRMGAEIERPLFWNGAKGVVRDMSHQELADYLKDREEEEKNFLKAKYNRD